MSLRVLYLPGKRSRWLPLLEASETFEVRSVDVRSGGRARTLPGIFLFPALAALRFRPHLLLSEYAGIYQLGLLPLRRSHRPLVLGVKGDPWREAGDHRHSRGPARARLQLFSSIRLLRRADLLLPLTPALETSLQQHLGSVTTRVVPIPVMEAEEQRAVGSSRPYALTVTSFRFWAKARTLVEVGPRVASTLAELGLEWKILGEGRYLERVKAELSSFEAVHFCGHCDPQPYYRGAFFFLYASGLDGLPSVVLEAALHGLAIVVQSETPAAEVVAASKLGLAADLGSVAGQESLRRLALDSGYRRLLGDAAEVSARSRFSPSAVAAQLELALASFA